MDHHVLTEDAMISWCLKWKERKGYYKTVLALPSVFRSNANSIPVALFLPQ